MLEMPFLSGCCGQSVCTFKLDTFNLKTVTLSGICREETLIMLPKPHVSEFFEVKQVDRINFG